MSVSASVINIKGEFGEKVKLPDEVFGKSVSPSLTAASVRVYLSNQRTANAKTKTRSEVKKTTAKMYKQKGTGRARHGSYSAPVFVGGGISHGPDGKQNYKGKLIKKNVRQVIASALSEKANDGSVILFSEPAKFEGKTKAVTPLIKKLISKKESILLITSIKQNLIRRAFTNVARVSVITSNQLNSYLPLVHSKLLFTDEGLKDVVKLLK